MCPTQHAFEFRSHPELRRPEKPITRAGARRFVQSCRKHGITVIPQFQNAGLVRGSARGR